MDLAPPQKKIEVDLSGLSFQVQLIDLRIRTRSLLGANEALYQVELQAHVNMKGKT